ncbi:25486_t:CDS:2, partial [Gigaspora rosea]
MNVHRNIHHDKLLFDNKLIDDFFKGEHTHDSEHSTFMFKIPFDQFTDLTCINKGGFSAIYKATWKCDHENEIDVVLKVIEDTKNMDSAFLNEGTMRSPRLTLAVRANEPLNRSLKEGAPKKEG